MSTIRERQDQIRAWWRHNRTTRAMLAYQAASWNDPVHIERWTDMQALLACYDHGDLLARENIWTVLEKQLSYPALWLAKNWDLKSVKKVSRNMESTYHVLQRKNNKIQLTPVTNLFRANIQAPNNELYEWLGVTGGHLEVDPLNLLLPSGGS